MSLAGIAVRKPLAGQQPQHGTEGKASHRNDRQAERPRRVRHAGPASGRIRATLADPKDPMMDTPTALLTFIHVLVLVYWLGGDLGAFYGSNFLVDPKRSLAERRMALKILNTIDMAPRTALILALPTGLGLAWMKGWVELPAYVPLLVAVASFVWLLLAWAVHLNHDSTTDYKKADLLVRYAVLAALFVTGIAALIGRIELPLFIALKMIILATCITLGLIVRKQIVPMFVAFRQMVEHGATPATDAAIATANANARRMVLTLWALLLVAAYLGVATPV